MYIIIIWYTCILCLYNILYYIYTIAISSTENGSLHFPSNQSWKSQVEEASDRSGNDDDMEKRVAKLSESLEKREEQAMDLTQVNHFMIEDAFFD